MKQYESPQVEVVRFSENDFAAQIATSGCGEADCPTHQECNCDPVHSGY